MGAVDSMDSVDNSFSINEPIVDASWFQGLSPFQGMADGATTTYYYYSIGVSYYSY